MNDPHCAASQCQPATLQSVVMFLFVSGLLIAVAVYEVQQACLLTAQTPSPSVDIIIIIIKCIYKAHFCGCHKCAKNSSYTLNNNVFSLFLNVVRVMSDDLSSSGRLFHTRGP